MNITIPHFNPPPHLKSLDVLAFNVYVYCRDQTDDKQVHLFDTSTGKPLNDGKPYLHKHEVSLNKMYA